MNYLFTFFIFYFTLINYSISQNTQIYEVIYNSNYKPIKGSSNYKNFNYSVFTDGYNALGQWSNDRKLDSISEVRALKNKDVSKYKTYRNSSVEYSNNTIRFYGLIGNEIYTYKEELCLNWSLKAETKTVNGYNCKKAELNYRGRNWTAWYTDEVPLQVGPYKFYGLPGLIIKIWDKTRSYNFELVSINKLDYKMKLKRSTFAFAKDKPIAIDRINYLKLKHKFKSMTFNESIQYMNRNKDVHVELELFSEDGDKKSFREYSNKGKLNFIELDYLD